MNRRISSPKTGDVKSKLEGEAALRRLLYSSHAVVWNLGVPLGSALLMPTVGRKTMVISSLWNTRRQAERDLSEDLEPFAGLLNESFSDLDDCVYRLEMLSQPFGRICALVLIKARNLGLGCYSLSLDALAQEAGALFMPALECLELLTYIRLDPRRIDEALEDRLPEAGAIAQRIEGKFKGLRGHLNAHASHLSVSPEAMGIWLTSGRGGYGRFNRTMREYYARTYAPS